MLEKPKLFLTPREFWLTGIFLLVLISLRFFFLYGEYKTFINKPFYYTDVTILQSYIKDNGEKRYQILKLYAPELNLNFFTRSNNIDKKFSSQLRIKLYPSNEMGFSEYLGTSFIHTQINESEKSLPIREDKIFSYVDKQHASEMIDDFYKAIFFADPLEKDLREVVSRLGVSHLIALSGFHLAILSTLLFFLLRPIYHFVQKRYFPYRYDLLDVGFVVLVLLAYYVVFVGAPHSLVRSYAMMFMGWSLLLLGIELLSFSFLFMIVLLLLLIFPQMLLSLAFWFSVMGVFYIFLLLRYFAHLNRYLITLIISFGIFILMLPLVHTIFPLTSPLQLLSPLLSLIFTFFYPLSMGLHVVGQGDFFDPLLLILFSLESQESYVFLTPWYGVGYLLLSLLAIYSRVWFSLLFVVAFGFSVYLFMGF